MKNTFLKTVSILLVTLPLFALSPVVKEAAIKVANGSANEAEKIFAYTHQDAINEYAIIDKDFKEVYQKAEQTFIERQEEYIRKVEEKFHVKANAKRPKGRLNPGRDTDIDVIPNNTSEKLTLEKIKEMEHYHEQLILEDAQKYGIQYEGKAGIETDYLPNPNYTTDAEFEKIADYINNVKGGTAYRTRKAALAEFKKVRIENLNDLQEKLNNARATGHMERVGELEAEIKDFGEVEPFSADEVAEYAEEMKWQTKRKMAKAQQLRNDLGKARATGRTELVDKIEAKIQLNHSQQSKYAKRMRDVNNHLRKELGLEPINDNGAFDKAIKKIEEAKRGVQSVDAATTVGANADAIIVKEQEHLVATLMKKAEDPVMRKALAQVINDLPPSSQANVIDSMETILGSDDTIQVIQEAKALRAARAGAEAEEAAATGEGTSIGGKIFRVGMIGVTAYAMGESGVNYALRDVRPDESVAEFVANVFAGAVYDGSGFGPAFEQATREMQSDYAKRMMRGEGSGNAVGDITVTMIKTVSYMGKNMVVGLLYMPDAIWAAIKERRGEKWNRYAKQMDQIYARMRSQIALAKKQKEIKDKAKKLGVHPEDFQKLFACLCEGAGDGMLGTSFQSGKGCVSCGPLTCWSAKLPSSRKTIMECSNRIAKENYDKNRAIFEKFHKLDAATYKKIQRLIAVENEKRIKATLEEINTHIKKREAIASAKAYISVQDSVLPEHRKYLERKIINGLNVNGRISMEKRDMKKAAQAAELAYQIQPHRAALKKTADDYKRWQKTWPIENEKLYPDIDKEIASGHIKTAEKKLQDLYQRIYKGEFPPPGVRWRTTNDALGKKRDAIGKACQKTMNNVLRLEQEKNPHAILEVIDAYPKTWEYNCPCCKERSYYAKRVANAEYYERLGDDLVKAKNYPNALEMYRKSVELQISKEIKGKIASLMERQKLAIEYQRSAASDEAKKKYKSAIKKYRQSIEQWPNALLENHIKAQELLQKSRKFWKNGKLQPAIVGTSQAQQLAGEDKIITKTLKAMQIQKRDLDAKLKNAEKAITQDKFVEAEKVLVDAARINDKYQKYKEVLQKLANAKQKSKDDKKAKELAEAELAKKIQDTRDEVKNVKEKSVGEKSATINQTDITSVGKGSPRDPGNPLTIGKGINRVSSGSSRAGGNTASLIINKKVYEPNEQIRLNFRSDPEKNAWIGMYKSEIVHTYEAPHITYQNSDAKANGERIFNAPNSEGTYQFRLYGRKNHKELVVLPFKVKVDKDAASLTVNKKIYEPNEKIALNFKATPLQNVWIGMYDAKAKHSYDTPNITYQNSDAKSSGEKVFGAPNKEGAYEFRLYERTNHKELAVLPFRVKVDKDAAKLTINKAVYEPNEKIVLNFKATPLQNVWIGMYNRNAKHSYDAENITYQNSDAKASGERVFIAPNKEGTYEFRLYERTNQKELLVLPFVVKVKKEAATLKIDKNIYEPLEKIKLHFTATVLQNIWIGMYDSSTKHSYDTPNITYQNGDAKASGDREFTAPQKEGKYEFRLYERTNNKELFVLPFTIRVNKDAASLSIPKSVYQKGEKIELRFTATSLQNVWIGMYKSATEHAYSASNLTYQNGDAQTSGDREFTAPSESGSYQFRLYERTNQKELVVLPFSVE